MRRTGQMLALLVLVAPCCAFASEGVKVRTQISPDHAIVGEEVRLFVDVLFPAEMLHPPRVEVPGIEGAQVFRFESQATALTDTIGGHTYTGQRFEFDLYARRAGALRVPPARVTLLDQGGNVLGVLGGAEEVLQAEAPPGFDLSHPVLASSHVSLRENWGGVPKHLRAGDALTRTIRRSADSLPSLAFADLPLAAPEGVRTYPEAPIVHDDVERGEVTGRRSDRVTYLFEQPGHYTLPAVAQRWWDLQSGRSRTLRLPARVVDIAPAVVAAPALKREGGLLWKAGAILLLATAAAGSALFVRGRVARAGGQSHPARAERAAFHALRRACGRDNPAAIYRAWQKWEQFRADATRPEALAQSVRKLEHRLFGPFGAEWSGADAVRMRKAAAAARAGRRTILKRAVLPPLNQGRGEMASLIDVARSVPKMSWADDGS